MLALVEGDTNTAVGWFYTNLPDATLHSGFTLELTARQD